MLKIVVSKKNVWNLVVYSDVLVKELIGDLIKSLSRKSKQKPKQPTRNKPSEEGCYYEPGYPKGVVMMDLGLDPDGDDWHSRFLMKS